MHVLYTHSEYRIEYRSANHATSNVVVKSTRLKQGDMFSYRFLGRRRRWRCSRDNFWTTFQMFFNFGIINGPIDHLFRFWSILAVTLT